MKLGALRELYRTTLLEDVIPWWIRHGIDGNGGINTCIRDDGSLVNRDRWNWSQWRAVWVFSKLYNQIEPRQQWLDIARGIHDFAAAHGPLPNDHWPLLLDGDGAVKRGYESVYVDCFAIYGLAELYRATGDPAVLNSAMRTFKALQEALHSTDPLPSWPYPVPAGRINHGISMISAISLFEFAEVSGSTEVRQACLNHHNRVFSQFLRPGRGLVVEWLNKDGTECHPPEGTVVVPGHAIESMWFQMHIAQAIGERTVIPRAIDAIRRHLEFGWDEQYGGIFLARDAEGGEQVGWEHAETKLWWPHVEALYGTLLAWEHCREAWCLQWHKRVREYCWAHFPVAESGEWRQKLTRTGIPITKTLFLPVKDPFHLPRVLIYLMEVLDRLIEDDENAEADA